MTNFVSELKMRHINNVRSTLKAEGLTDNQLTEALAALAADTNSAWARSIRLLETVARKA